MKAVVWHGKEDVRVDTVPDPRIEAPTDAIVRITSKAICGSDLHLYAKLGLAMKEGDIIGHEPMGVVEEVGTAVEHIKPGDRVVIPFNISCGSCWLCERQPYSQCETTQNRRWKKGASLFGYTHLYGAVPGGQAEYLRVPMAHFGPIKVPEGPPDTRFLFLSDARVRHDAVGMEAEATIVGRALQATKLLPDRFGALVSCARSLRRGGTLSICGVYVGAFPLLPLGELFDRQISVLMGQANVRRWSDEILPLLNGDDPLGMDDLATHTLPLERAPHGYDIFQRKTDGAIKVVLQP